MMLIEAGANIFVENGLCALLGCIESDNAQCLDLLLRKDLDLIRKLYIYILYHLYIVVVILKMINLY